MIRILAVLVASAGAAAAWLFGPAIKHYFSKPGWHVTYGENFAHVWPCRDVQEHWPREDCWCGVITTPIEQEGGSIGWVFKHQAFDGRELTEDSEE